MLHFFGVVLAAAFGIGLGIVYNKFVIKDYPESDRKTYRVITVVLFLLITLALYGVLQGSRSLKGLIKEQTHRLELQITETYPDNEFVKNGFDLNLIGNDLARLNMAIIALKNDLPSHTELGVPKVFYDMGVKFLTKELHKKFAIADQGLKAANAFAGEDNILTVSSMLNGLRQGGIRTVNIVSIIAASVFALVLIVYVLVTLVIVNKERRKKTGEAQNAAV